MGSKLFIYFDTVSHYCACNSNILSRVIKFLICNYFEDPANNELCIVFKRASDRKEDLAVELEIEIGNGLVFRYFIIENFLATGHYCFVIFFFFPFFPFTFC